MEANGTESPVMMNRNTNDVQLEEEKLPQEGHFVGATLEIGGENRHADPEVEFASPGFNRNRPGSTIGRQSVRSTTSRTSMKVGALKSDKQTERFFCYKDNAFDKAVEKCKETHMKTDIDGAVTGSWLLSEIDHWDNEREKIVILTENSVLMFKFNFITSKLEDFRRLSLHIVDTILIGDFRYPEYSIMPVVSNDRMHGGIQIRWNKGQEPSFGQRWNPWCSSIPWTTFCHHPLLYNNKESETVTYNVDDFYESLIQAVSKAYNRKKPGEKVTVIEGPIEINSYASLASMVFNQSGLGYCKDRNGLSF